MGDPPTRHLEVTPINRQSYMAEISSLLGLITDEHTREVLIAKMEHMFDAAEDEQKLISDIGSPTKVAVALIRYADNGVVTPEAAAVIDTVTEDDPEQEAEYETLEALDEQPELLIPEEETKTETAPETEPEAEPEAKPEPEAEPEAKAEEAPAPEEPEELDLLTVLKGESEPAPAEPEAEPETAPEALFSAPETLDAPTLEPAPVEAVPVREAEPEELPEKAPEEAPEAELAPVDEDADAEALEEAEAEAYDAEAEDEEDDDEPLTITKVNTFLAILYFIIPGLVIGLPVFLVLLVLNLAFLVVAAVVTTAAVLLVLTGLTPLGLPDMLLCFGGAAAIAAIGLVLLWFSIWFFICVTCGWVRLMTSGGKRISRKEVEIV